MLPLSRREFLRRLAQGSIVIGSGSLLSACGENQSSNATQVISTANAAPKGFSLPDEYYSMPMSGDARILHTTDFHGQLLPVFFREPNVNLGVGDAFARPPHVVGAKLLKEMGLDLDSPEAYAYTYLKYDEVAPYFGRMGGFAHMKTLMDMLREQAGGRDKTLALDGGDLWQGSGTSLWTRGMDMVEASNILGIDVMVGHWEFTYKEDEVLSNVSVFKGDFIGQNVRVKEDALFGDEYATMVEKYDGRGLYSEESGHAFQPYVLKEVGGAKIAVVGQAFPRTANANPPEFFPDWSFGLREDDMAALVEDIQGEHNPDAIVLLSHNGMDVDIKMAERVPGLNAVFGGHTHDAMPEPVKVKNPAGHECWVTNAGSNGKVLGAMDFKLKDGGGIESMSYKMFPIFSDILEADKEMTSFISQMRSKKYDNNIVESRASDRQVNPARVGKTFDEILTEKLAIADRTLYRRGNFMGTWDQVLCNAL
ncbi:MAG: thiosulfohydrolase SoxB, partial [Gammaproteobacteria bacterium]